MSLSFREQSRRMALCAMMAALSGVIVLLGGVIPLATFTCPILAMLCLIPPVCEYGSRTGLLTYAAAALLALILAADKEMALFYFFLGYYPAVRPLLGRLRNRALRVGVKCALFAVSMTLMYLLVLYLFRLEAVVQEFASYSPLMLIALAVLGMATFLLMDRALNVLTLVYRHRLRRFLFRR